MNASVCGAHREVLVLHRRPVRQLGRVDFLAKIAVLVSGKLLYDYNLATSDRLNGAVSVVFTSRLQRNNDTRKITANI